MAIERKAVNSGLISSIGYDEGTQTLVIEFKNGKAYQYNGVPQDAYNDLLGAESIGSHFHHNIKGKYDYSPLPEQTENVS